MEVYRNLPDWNPTLFPLLLLQLIHHHHHDQHYQNYHHDQKYDQEVDHSDLSGSFPLLAGKRERIGFF